TNPLPAAVTLDWLGFPESDWAKLAGPIHDIFAALPGSERAVRGAAGLAYLDQRIRELIVERRAAPTGDAVSYLAAQRRPDGELFDADELVSVIGLLIAGGVDTTTSLTGSTLVHLSRHPEDRQRLIDSPDLLLTATDEFLRVFAPSQSMARTVRTDTEVGGCPVTAGERVLIPPARRAGAAPRKAACRWGRRRPGGPAGPGRAAAPGGCSGRTGSTGRHPARG
ncbi:cytochrome P450, partial [Streptomyces sp. NPDC052644]